MEEATLKNKVLFVGRPIDNIYEILQGLFTLSKTPVPKELNPPHQPSLALSFDLVTKYYEAKLGLWIDVIDEEVTEEVVNGYKELVDNVDGFCFIYDVNEKNSLETLTKFLPLLDNGDINVILSVCVGSVDINSTQSNNSDMSELCIENGIEFIDLSTGVKEDGSIDRIYEALQTNQWDGLILKQKNMDLSEDKDMFHDLLPDHHTDLPTDKEIKSFNKTLFPTGPTDDSYDPFATLQSLREQAQGMPLEQRRKLAAKVALSIGMQFDADSSGNEH